MKSIAKLGLLLALVVAGRFFRPSAAPASSASTQVSQPSSPDTSFFAAFASEPSLPVAPASQHRALPPQQAVPDSLTWF